MVGLAGLGIKDFRLTKLAMLQVMISKPSEYRFFDATAVSCGWISPAGEYFFDTTLRDRGSHYDLAFLIYEKYREDRFRDIVRQNPKAGVDDITYIIFKEMIRDGWIKISNAFNIECEMPRRETLDAFVSLFLSYDRPPMALDIFLTGKGYQMLFQGNILEFEKFVNRL